MYKEVKEEKKTELKPDKLVHKTNKMGTMAKKDTLPGQIYVPKTTLSVDDFAADHL
jgi:hypothetical protein